MPPSAKLFRDRVCRNIGQLLRLAGLAALSGAAGAMAAPQYRAIDLGQVRGVAINNRGEVLANSASGAMIFGQVGEIYLGQVSAQAMNDVGQVVGTFRGTTGNHVFLWSEGAFADLGRGSEILDWGDSLHTASPTAINNLGQFGGIAGNKLGGHVAWVYRDGKFVWPEGANGGEGQSILAINDSGQHLGFGWGPMASKFWIYESGDQKVHWHETRLDYIQPLDLNAHGEVLLAFGGGAAIWTPDQVIMLDGRGAAQMSRIYSFNGQRQVLGTFSVSGSPWQAPLLYTKDVAYELADLLEAVPADWRYFSGQIFDINEHGEILLSGYVDREFRSFKLVPTGNDLAAAPIPEPTTYTLLAFGLALLAYRRQRASTGTTHQLA